MVDSARRTEWILFILILLIGGMLRFVALDEIPPGLTHDEADHVSDAIGVAAGSGRGDRSINNRGMAIAIPHRHDIF